VGALAGHTADQRDCQAAQAALQRMNAASIGTRIAWSSTTGSYGAVTPVSDERTVNNRVCREIRADYYIKNHAPVLGEAGLVCRTENGDWARVEAPSS
jgi:surface antigen